MSSLNKECFIPDKSCEIVAYITVNKLVKVFNTDLIESTPLVVGTKYPASKKEIDGVIWLVLPDVGNRGLPKDNWQRLHDNLIVDVVNTESKDFFDH